MLSFYPTTSTRSNENEPICVLASGGLDSCILVAIKNKQQPEVYPVYIRQGLHWEYVEILWLQRFLNALKADTIHKLTVLDLPVADLYGVHWSTTGKNVPDADTEDSAVYLPGRNVLLLTKAAVFCAMQDIHQIAIGVSDHNPFSDATPEFFGLIETAFSSAMDSPIHIIRPFASLSKKAITQLGSNLPLELSFSCINPQGELHCGVCNKCSERKKGFREASLEDKSVYLDSSQ